MYEKKVLVSEKFAVALRDFPEKKYLLAAKVNVHPSFISQIVNQAVLLKRNDQRVKRISKAIKFKGECFEPLMEEQTAVK
ncbi:MAG: hypothetical protein AB1847_22820 [bacterium]